MSSNIFQFSPLLMIFRAEAGEVTEIVTRLLIQLAVILFAAKLTGEIATRYSICRQSWPSSELVSLLAPLLWGNCYPRLWPLVPHSRSGWCAGGDP